MNTLIIRTKENLNTILLRNQSGRWVLTNKKLIHDLITNGELQIHPIVKGPYNNILHATITNITDDPTDPRRKIIHFNNAHIKTAPIQYKVPWVVRVKK